MKSNAYHSALKGFKVEDSEPVERFDYGNSVAFRHDIYDPYPSNLYQRCDIIYTEPPWPAGSTVFDKRLGIEGRRWADLAQHLAQTIASVDIPVVLTAGKSFIKYLPTPDYTAEVTYSGSLGKCLVFAYRTTLPDLATGDEIKSYIMSNYNCIGDWFCGYGQTAFAALEAGKDFVVSDYNPQCIGYIKDFLTQEGN